MVDQGLIDEIQVLETSRIGGCEDGPEMIVYPEGVHYLGFNADDVPFIVEEHFLKGRIVEKFREMPKVVVDEELGPLRPKELRVVLKNCGYIDPTNIEDYLAADGYQALGKAIFEMQPQQVIDEVLKSGLRGRGGAGFPAGKKWNLTRQVDDSPKYMVCNADEGDPGAFMNRRVLEGELQFPLLDGQHVLGFALDVNGRMRDAVPVDKARGQAVFEDITRGQVDPGLLQVTQGNNFKLRVYPIPAQGTRQVLIRYAETLQRRAGRLVYRLPLEYADTVDSFRLDLNVAGAKTPPEKTRGQLDELNFKPAGSGYHAQVSRDRYAGRGMLELEIPPAHGARAYTQTFDGITYFYADLPVPARAAARVLPRIVGLVWD
ncbi:MAG: VIT domain-containing protein, partial [Sulfuricaulis sp.]|nr:VIT domain-containing protein [Sulfuricaulis sp.]